MLSYTSQGYNLIYGSHHRKLKIYSDQDVLCANFIRDVRLAPDENSHLSEDINKSMSVQLNIPFSFYTYYLYT